MAQPEGPEADEQLLLIACVARDPAAYGPLRRRMWERAQVDFAHDGVATPRPYAGSLDSTCEDCGITVAVGPRQQAHLLDSKNAGIPVAIVCLICGPIRMAENADGENIITGLENPGND